MGTKLVYLPVDYARHDDVYRRLRARGATGWDAAMQYDTLLGLVAPTLPALTSESPPRILELGSGAGDLSLLLAARGYIVTGVDISRTAVDWANERLSVSSANPSFRVDNVVDLATCSSGSFDAVVDGRCLHCIIGDDRSRCLAAVRRVLKPGGLLVVISMCGEVLDETRRAQFDPVTNILADDGRPSRYIGGADAIVSEVRKAGFDIEDVHIEPRGSTLEQDDVVIAARRADTTVAGIHD